MTMSRSPLSRRDFTLALTASLGALSLPLGAAAADDLRVAFIPEAGASPDQIAAKQPLIDMIAKATGRTVKLFVTTSYAATVEAIGNDGVDIAYLGGLTYVKAHDKYGVKPLVQRTEDKQYHSLFITGNPAINSVKDLKGKTFAFGDINSTSGHLIPAKEMYEVGVDPNKDLKTSFTGNHPATAQAVASGQADAGAIDEGIYRKLVAEKTIDPAKARVFYTSKPFVDYVWVASKSVDEKTALAVSLGFQSEVNPAFLKLLRATKFVKADDKEYDGIREIARKEKLL